MLDEVTELFEYIVRGDISSDSVVIFERVADVAEDVIERLLLVGAEVCREGFEGESLK